MITPITPPSEFLLDERVFMSLGILKVAAALEAVGEQVEHLDLSGVENFMDVVAEYAQSGKSKVFGITATTPQMPSANTASESFLDPTGKVIIGGPHATLAAAARKQRKAAPPSQEIAYSGTSIQLSQEMENWLSGLESRIWDWLMQMTPNPPSGKPQPTLK